MTDIFDRVLHHYGRKGEKLFSLNIGAMDGVLFDELIGYSTSYNFKGLYVEPIPYLFERLKNNIGEDGNLFENAAISEENGTIKMMTIDQEAIDSGKVHPCFYGMSAVYPPKNGLSSDGDKDVVEQYGKIIDVPCITLDTLLKKHNISSFDVLKIDAEGHDYQIFKQLNLGVYRPKVIRLEWVNLDKEQQKNILDIFTNNNYRYEFLEQDIIAAPIEIYEELEEPVQSKPKPDSNSGITLVTGLWNIRRDSLSEG